MDKSCVVIFCNVFRHLGFIVVAICFVFYFLNFSNYIIKSIG